MKTMSELFRVSLDLENRLNEVICIWNQSYIITTVTKNYFRVFLFL